jgi:hypothetical protein
LFRLVAHTPGWQGSLGSEQSFDPDGGARSEQSFDPDGGARSEQSFDPDGGARSEQSFDPDPEEIGRSPGGTERGALAELVASHRRPSSGFGLSGGAGHGAAPSFASCESFDASEGGACPPPGGSPGGSHSFHGRRFGDGAGGHWVGEGLEHEVETSSDEEAGGAACRSRGSGRRGGRAGVGFKYRRLKSGLFYVTEVREGGAAWRSGQLRAGDTLTHVDGASLLGVSTEALGEMLLGANGTEVALTLQRGSGGAAAVEARLVRRVGGAGGGGAPRQPESIGAIGAEHATQGGSTKGSGGSAGAPRGGAAGGGRASLGFKYKPGADGAWLVASLKAGGFAERSGRIRPGDRLLAVGASPSPRAAMGHRLASQRRRSRRAAPGGPLTALPRAGR